MTDGTVFSCGTNGNAQLGDGTYTQRNTLVPMIMPSGKSASSVACGQYHTVVRMTDGTVFSCGYPYYGTFGDNITNTIGTLLVPMIMPSGKSASAVSATGFLSTVVRMTDGTVFSCGYNSNGQLGDGTTTQRNTLVPMIIPSGKTAENVFCGNNHTVVVMTDGTVFSCGWNGSGQLGDGTTTQRNTLVRIYIITDTSTSNILPMYNAGVPLSAMLLNGITISQMFNVGITLVQMLAGNITTSQMFNGGITIAQMLSAGITLSQMFNGGITIAQMLTAGITIAQMFNGGITLSQMFNGGITITQMFAANITITQMFNGGITISQMLAANITIAQMLTAGITLSQMFNGGITIAQMFNGGITLSQMFNGGIAATYFRPINVLFYKRDTYGDTWNGNVINIRNKSTGQVLTTLTLTTYGQNWSYDTGSLYYGVEYEITKVIGSFAYEVLYAITTSSVTSYNGSQTTISEGTDVILAQQTNAFPSLKIMDFSLTSNPFNISATQLKAAGYTATELKAAGYTQQEITGAGYSQTTNPSITNFGNLSKTVADSSFTIVAPSSTSTGAFSYTSSNPLVATISGSTVTILQAGTTTITALQEETSTYYRASISCTLTVISKVASNLLIGSVSAKKLGDAVFTLPVTTNSTGSISYTSSVPSVATISSVGLVTIVGAGSTVLTVSQLTDANYLAGSVTYTLTIEKTTSSLSMGSISEKTNGDVPFALVVTTNSTGVISYTSSNTSVATISNTGLVTIVGAGSTVLTVSQLTDANYLAKSVEGMLTVKESSSSNPTVISGGSGLSYFLNTSATYAILSGDISVSSGSLQSISKKVIKASKKMTIKRS
jgi:hypothetical protein